MRYISVNTWACISFGILGTMLCTTMLGTTKYGGRAEPKCAQISKQSY